MPPQAQPGRILVVDDDENYLQYMSTVLDDLKLPYFCAGSAYAAKKSIQTVSFPLIITDLVLPGSSGIDVLETALRKDPLTVVILMTGHGTVETALEALRKGAYDYLLKPCGPDEIGAAVNRALGYRRLKVELLRKTAQMRTFQTEFTASRRMIEDISRVLEAPGTGKPSGIDVELKVRFRVLRDITGRIGRLFQ